MVNIHIFILTEKSLMLDITYNSVKILQVVRHTIINYNNDNNQMPTICK